MALKYRMVQFRDLPSISVLENRYFTGFRPLSSIMISFISDSRFSFLCEDESRLVGAIMAEKESSCVMIHALCVEEEYSRMGIGRKLMAKCLESIKEAESGVDIVLMVKEQNKAAIGLYESFGFKIISLEKNAYFCGSNGYVMVIPGENINDGSTSD